MPSQNIRPESEGARPFTARCTRCGALKRNWYAADGRGDRRTAEALVVEMGLHLRVGHS
ncbi:hypothetical protein [Streptomyces sp. I05A-00742]|uniref:hypothetical protein n=1 Tax=Streptomyces sp. I05A-00742 TaxID=2732853 RepID=UPI001489041D|nr:hypothetical protein [Streptomyces sp. I05A-00742]